MYRSKSAMFGGRTETFSLKHVVKDDEKIKYADITSLYPTVMFYDKYPVGHPERITKDFGNIEDYFGMIKCKVRCPKDLLLPVLPVRDEKSGKLTFSLGDEKNEIIGTWCTPELIKAVEVGYEILKIYEVMNFNKSSKKLFKKYIAQFLKIKQEASGFLKGIETEEQKDKYINDYYNKMGIKLDKDKIIYNPGLRSVAKLCLNSLWGKFIQRLNMTQKKFVNKHDEFYKLIFDKTKNIRLINIINDDCLEISYSSKNEFVESTTSTNVYIGCFTTCNARLRLYKELELLGERALYCDTDSIIYVNKRKEYDIPIGGNLGEWKDELEGDYGVKFLSTGPKSYCYKLNGGGEECKIKGFTLNYENSLSLNGDSLEKIINKEVEKITITNHMITRSDRTLITNDIDKDFQFTSTKREYLDDFSSIPWGYDDVGVDWWYGNIFKS
eukprot:Lithocolla_globosa_v1_NODE_324_length_4471_cov_1015.959466.p1 type:complete len:441 gc:universal NODE_324_length_4471_cov_1015.959466:2576-1254(-)